MMNHFDIKWRRVVSFSVAQNGFAILHALWLHSDYSVEWDRVLCVKKLPLVEWKMARKTISTFHICEFFSPWASQSQTRPMSKHSRGARIGLIAEQQQQQHCLTWKEISFNFEWSFQTKYRKWGKEKSKMVGITSRTIHTSIERLWPAPDFTLWITPYLVFVKLSCIRHLRIKLDVRKKIWNKIVLCARATAPRKVVLSSGCCCLFFCVIYGTSEESKTSEDFNFINKT